MFLLKNISRLSLFNFQGPISLPALADSFVIISPLFPFVNTFLKVFLKSFSVSRSPGFWGSLISVTQQNSFVKYFFKLFSSFFLSAFHCVLSRDSLIILSPIIRFVNTFFDIFFVLLFNCTSDKPTAYVLYIFANNHFTTLKKQSVFRRSAMYFVIYC